MAFPEESDHSLKDLVEPVNLYINDPLAARLVRWLKPTFVTPNQITYLSVLVGFASGYSFSHGSLATRMIGGLLLEVALVLDCVDGQLARAKNMASEWGRLIDGVAGYFAYLAVVYGIMKGFPEYQQALIVVAVMTILRAISYDYCKQSFATMILKGHDGMHQDILNTVIKISKKKSWVLIGYFYYLQIQQMFFRGQWNSLSRMRDENEKSVPQLTLDQRKVYYEKIRPLLTLWRWNGLDLPLFLLALLSLAGILEIFILPLAIIMPVQYVMTLVFHHLLIHKS